jgi:cardiolipin synthase
MGPERATVASQRILTIPNVLSFIRLLLVPVFFVLIIAGYDAWALIVLIVSSLSDYFDGLIARRFNQVSRLGQLLDPAADRLFILAALVGLVIRGILPWWFAVIIVSRDVMLIVLGIILANHGYGPLPVHHLGKVGTLCLFYALPVLMLGHAFPNLQFVTDPVGWAFAIWGAFLYWWGGIVYAAQTGRLVRSSRVAP